MSWTAKQHLWKSKAKEGHHLIRDGPSNRQKKNDIKLPHSLRCSMFSQFYDKMAGLDYWPKVSLVLVLQKKEKYPWVGILLYTCECDDERACYLIIKKHVY